MSCYSLVVSASPAHSIHLCVRTTILLFVGMRPEVVNVSDFAMPLAPLPCVCRFGHTVQWAHLHIGQGKGGSEVFPIHRHLRPTLPYLRQGSNDRCVAAFNFHRRQSLHHLVCPVRNPGHRLYSLAALTRREAVSGDGVVDMCFVGKASGASVTRPA
ncbi:unnamed protein product [Protopolystoma xenopodis]|uniref:Uncharacterized protein n=1 Tax=Protopolystoma xenopodis TaxID=117903 RepID=A0A448WUJ0_9PLAT|nr:unnamed protein product [Protopolystoma xenopodis]